jgi:MFS family permease
MSMQQQIEQNLRHNYIVNFFDGAAFWLGASFFATRTILPLFISQLTDSNLAIGILSAIVTTGPLIPQLFTANWVASVQVKKDIPVKIGLFTERLPIISLVLAAWLATWSKSAALYFGLFCIAWFHIGIGFIAVGWQDMMAKLFPTRTRGRFMGATYFAGTAMGVLGAAGSSWVLDTYPFPINFMISFGLGGLFLMLSWVFLSMTREPPDPPNTTTSNKSIDWAAISQVLTHDKNFRRYVLSSVIAALGTMALGFLTVYALDTWQVSNSQVGLFTTYLLTGQAIGYLVFGWLADRYGHKLVLEISILLSVISLVIAIIAQSPQVFYAVFAIQGIYAAATMLSGINIVFEFCKADIRPTYIGLSNTVIGIFSGLAPILGGLLVDGINYTWLFGVAFVLSLIGFAALRYWVVEPRNNN